jgi:uncharacterized protein with HEPN domain
MSAVGNKERLGHMVDFARQARRLSRGRRRTSLDADELYYLAMNRLVEVIGEAARHVSKRFQNDHPEIPWAKIIGMRNHLIHGYDTIDSDVLWQVLRRDLPPLIASLDRILATETFGK